jgi:hypothetical protein
MDFPREILSLINCGNINLFKTCKQFYSNADIVYRNYYANSNDIVNAYEVMVKGCLLVKNPNYNPDLKNKIYRITGFNGSLKCLPHHITHLSFHDTFNKPVDNLPSTITHLTFGNNFNQSVNNLPSNLTHLTFW